MRLFQDEINSKIVHILGAALIVCGGVALPSIRFQHHLHVSVCMHHPALQALGYLWCIVLCRAAAWESLLRSLWLFAPAGEKTYYFDDVWFGSPPNTVNLDEFIWNNNKQNVIVFPNPSKENINIQTLNYSGIVEIQLFDLLGNNIINSCSRNLSIKQLKKGIYKDF